MPHIIRSKISFRTVHPRIRACMKIMEASRFFSAARLFLSVFVCSRNVFFCDSEPPNIAIINIVYNIWYLQTLDKKIVEF